MIFVRLPEVLLPAGEELLAVLIADGEVLEPESMEQGLRLKGIHS